VRDLDAVDRSIIFFLQGDMPLVSNPYKLIAEKNQINDTDIIARIQRMKHSGILKRISAVIRHQKAGFSANAMVVWEAERGRLDDAGEKAAAFKEVSHCYIRPFPDEEAPRLFTMVHARSMDELDKSVEKISRAIGVKRYAVLYSRRELKKESMQIM
jgi:DNA-binding Lrp family transcriptional regulator